MSGIKKALETRRLRSAAKGNLRDVEKRIGDEKDLTWEQQTQLIDAASWVQVYSKKKNKKG